MGCTARSPELKFLFRACSHLPILEPCPTGYPQVWEQILINAHRALHRCPRWKATDFFSRVVTLTVTHDGGVSPPAPQLRKQVECMAGALVDVFCRGAGSQSLLKEAGEELQAVLIPSPGSRLLRSCHIEQHCFLLKPRMDKCILP